ncbi:MAG: phytanoyl-CoA dioxygenase family protein [Planctomycetes bacterium]|nr:phytanoyl-CoA dioxygenase family protein [Planctomycetota bacterium]
MRLTKKQLRHYNEKGWLVVNGVFTAEQVERVASVALEQANKTIAPDAGTYALDRAPDGTLIGPRKLNRPFESNPQVYGGLIFDSPMPDLIEQLTGAPPLLFTDQIFFKPPHHGSPKAYHQDNGYFLMHPDGHVITAWIAMDDVDEENGCLRYIDGSQLGEILPCAAIPGREHDLTPDPALIDLSKESLAIVKKGGVVFHHSKALHCSGENRSPRWRRGYATHWVAADVTCETDLLKTGYYKRPELFADLSGRAALVRELPESVTK